MAKRVPSRWVQVVYHTKAERYYPCVMVGGMLPNEEGALGDSYQDREAAQADAKGKAEELGLPHYKSVYEIDSWSDVTP